MGAVGAIGAIGEMGEDDAALWCGVTWGANGVGYCAAAGAALVPTPPISNAPSAKLK